MAGRDIPISVRMASDNLDGLGYVMRITGQRGQAV